VFPRSPDDFRRITDQARGRWFEAAAGIGRALDGVLEILPELRAWIAANRKDRNLGPVAEDLDEQLAWLLRGRFAWHAGYARLCDYPRRFRAIRSRLGRIKALPLVKDLEKMERLRRWWTPWFRRWTAEPANPRHWEAGWLLEEHRVALFAPDVPTLGKVSEKRLEELLGR
jgi:ATP-dependent helicase HrpA